MTIATERSLVAADVVERRGEVLSAEIDGEVVALDVVRGLCFGLDCVGARIWALIESPALVGAICATLIAEYAVDAETCWRDVVDLLADLRAEGLITIRPSASTAAS